LIAAGAVLVTREPGCLGRTKQMAGIAVSAQLPVGEEALSGLRDLLSHKKIIDI
jgi:hypothetical protein